MVGDLKAKDFFDHLRDVALGMHLGREVDASDLIYRIGNDNGRPRLGWAVPIETAVLKEWLRQARSALAQDYATVFVGMGGSINTVKTIRQLYPELEDKILILDNPDEAFVKGQLEGRDLSRLKVVAISKSATTFETHVISGHIKKVYESAGMDIYQHITWLTDPENAPRLAEKGWDLERLNVLSIQPDGKSDIGGRFTCPRTALFLLPMAILLSDEELIRLNEEINRKELDEDFINLWYQKAEKVVAGKDDIHPCIAIVMSDKFSRAEEGIRIWINQLIQESLGGKAEDFDPKTIVFIPSQDPELAELLEKKGVITLNFAERLDSMAELTIALEYFTSAVAWRYSLFAGEELNFVNQPNVQLYKERMKQISEIEELTPVDLNGVAEEIASAIDRFRDLKFVEWVYYGPDEETYETVKKEARRITRPRCIELVFRGPDWNHHAFQSAPTCRHTLFCILVDSRADESVKKIAQATRDVLRDRGVKHTYRWFYVPYF